VRITKEEKVTYTLILNQDEFEALEMAINPQRVWEMADHYKDLTRRMQERMALEIRGG
jgi:hypothetical protein